ncbi:hypothetical protein LWC33_22490 [Pseudonocardia sp. RS11V-5]|uniref:hypothetical protein n=1 Tax=Pseudonocardia terrae TaxID=2905831 RepID=UPI001E34FC99|nr:hypothetical protein [Pseudonocardia terrae]MCE3554208.1 hypothetical protein [Pseudonocardia terrae]
MDDLRRFRLAVRDRGLRRASRVTGWAAAGGVAATVVAAVVFARTPASADTEDPAPAAQPGVTSTPPTGTAPDPVPDAAAAPVPRTGAAPSTAPPVRHHARSTTSGGGASTGNVLQPPATAPQPVSGSHAHVSSGAS